VLLILQTLPAKAGFSYFGNFGSILENIYKFHGYLQFTLKPILNPFGCFRYVSEVVPDFCPSVAKQKNYENGLDVSCFYCDCDGSSRTDSDDL